MPRFNFPDEADRTPLGALQLSLSRCSGHYLVRQRKSGAEAFAKAQELTCIAAAES
jgi:hypothetical protein